MAQSIKPATVHESHLEQAERRATAKVAGRGVQSVFYFPEAELTDTVGTDVLLNSVELKGARFFRSSGDVLRISGSGTFIANGVGVTAGTKLRVTIQGSGTTLTHTATFTRTNTSGTIEYECLAFRQPDGGVVARTRFLCDQLPFVAFTGNGILDFGEPRRITVELFASLNISPGGFKNNVTVGEHLPTIVS